MVFLELFKPRINSCPSEFRCKFVAGFATVESLAGRGYFVFMQRGFLESLAFCKYLTLPTNSTMHASVTVAVPSAPYFFFFSPQNATSTQ